MTNNISHLKIINTLTFIYAGSLPYLGNLSVQSLSHVQLWDPMDCNMPGFPVYHQLPDLTQTHVNLVISIGATILSQPGLKIPFTDNLEANIL